MNMTRRTALKGLAVASSLSLFNIGCANFGMSRARQIAKGSKIRVALIGCGLQTANMIDGVLCEDLVAIVDPDPARLAWLDRHVADTCGAAERENYAKARRFATYQDMFEKMGGEIDAIVVETPNHQHVLPAVMAMRRGIHVYLDKPLCLTAAECDLILAEARKNPGLVTQCGTYGHSFPSMKYCVDRIAEGALGEVREVWAYDDRCNSIYQRPAAVPPPKGMDWDLWCGGSPVCDFYPVSRRRFLLQRCVHGPSRRLPRWLVLRGMVHGSRVLRTGIGNSAGHQGRSHTVCSVDRARIHRIRIQDVRARGVFQRDIGHRRGVLDVHDRLRYRVLRTDGLRHLLHL